MIGTRMSMALMTKDAKKSAKWYKEKLGFQASVEGHWVTVWPKGAGWKVHLCEGEASDMEPGNSGVALYVKDLEREYKRLKAKGVKFAMPVTTKPWGTFALLKDLDGNELWLYPGGP
jgi:predicted enzyme related to lactoylglutathione lyase